MSLIILYIHYIFYFWTIYIILYFAYTVYFCSLYFIPQQKKMLLYSSSKAVIRIASLCSFEQAQMKGKGKTRSPILFLSTIPS